MPWKTGPKEYTDRVFQKERAAKPASTPPRPKDQRKESLLFFYHIDPTNSRKGNHNTGRNGKGCNDKARLEKEISMALCILGKTGISIELDKTRQGNSTKGGKCQ